MLFLAILVILTSLAIASVAAYFSVIGLSLLFVGSGTSIIIMGGALEVGKLITATVLHQMWDKMSWLLKTYLFIATFVLMCITSIGIYGYLSNGYNATSIKVKALEKDIASVHSKIELYQAENKKLENYIPPTKATEDINNDGKKFLDQQLQLIAQKETRINEIRSAIEKDKISAAAQIQNAKNVLDEQVSKESAQIPLYNNRLQILDKEVQTWLDQGTGGWFKANGLEKAREVKQAQQKEREEIDNKIKSVQNNIDRLRTEYTKTVADINNNLLNLTRANEQTIARYQQEIAADKLVITNNQNKSQNILVEQKTKVEEVLVQNATTIKNNLAEIEKLNSEIKTIEEKIVSTDVGTFKFVAKSIGTDLDKTVNWFILTIIFVFDPLAVALLLCFNYILSYKILKKKETKVEAHPYTHNKKITSNPVSEFNVDESATQTYGQGDQLDLLDVDRFPYKHLEAGKPAFKPYPPNDNDQ